MKYRLIAFDFDGTLVDSFPAFLYCLNQAAEKHGFKKISNEDLKICRSISAIQLMRRLGIPIWKVPAITRDMRKAVLHQTDRIQPFEGITELVQNLHGRGVSLAIVSSNTHECAKAVLGNQCLGLFEHRLFGASLLGKRYKLKELLRNSKTPSRLALYVGDELRDADAARSLGMDFCAVSWGYTLPEAFRNQYRLMPATTLRELRAICLGEAAVKLRAPVVAPALPSS